MSSLNLPPRHRAFSGFSVSVSLFLCRVISCGLLQLWRANWYAAESWRSNNIKVEGVWIKLGEVMMLFKHGGLPHFPPLSQIFQNMDFPYNRTSLQSLPVFCFFYCFFCRASGSTDRTITETHHTVITHPALFRYVKKTNQITSFSGCWWKQDNEVKVPWLI